MTARWIVVLLTATALVVTPVAVSARRPGPVDVAASTLAARIAASSSVGWSGRVRSDGSLQVPKSDSFATLGDLLGQRNDLRVWWRSPQDWRVDRIRSTGETDLFHQGRGQVRWIFESQRAVFSPVSRIRLPDAPDVLPATLGRQLLQGARPAEVTRLPTRLIAGVAAPGLRLVTDNPTTTVSRVDLWADPDTGLVLRVELYGIGVDRPVLSTAVTALNLATPDPATTQFRAPQGIRLAYEESVDVAAAANALYPFDLPRRLAGLEVRDGADPGAVGIYGRGPTTMIALPLQGQVARPLRNRLDDRAAEQTPLGTLAPVGPINVLLTPPRARGGGFLLAGTVTRETLQRAAAQLLGAR